MSRGHPLQKVLREYTQDQVDAFYKAALQNHKDSVKDMCIAVRIANHAKPADYKKYLKDSLDKGKSKSDRPTREEIDKVKEMLTHGKSTRNR